MEIPSGLIADSVGRRKSMIFSFLSYIASFLMFFFFKSFSLYFVAMVFFAAGEAFRTGTHKAMIMEYLRRNGQLDLKVHYYGHTRSWSQRGSAVSSLIAGAIVFSTSNYHSVFLFSVIPYVLELFLMLSYPSYLDFSQSGDSRESQTLSQKLKASLRGLKSVLADKESRKTLINSSIFEGVFKSLKDYIQPLLKNFIIMIPLFTAYSRKERLAVLTAVVYFVLYMLTSFASKYSGKGISVFRSHEEGLNMTYLTAVAAGASIGLCVYLGLYLPAIILFIFYYVLQNFRRPVMTGYLSGKIPPEAMAAGLSVESQGKTILTAVIAPAAGFFADRLGLGAAIAILAALLLIVYPFFKFKTPEE